MNYKPKTRNKYFLLVILIFSSLISVYSQKNRSVDGSGNNLSNPSWGQVGQQLLRLSPSEYGDSISSASGSNRMNARQISNILFSQSNLINDTRNLSDFCWVFGQFVDHDITLVPGGTELAFIPVPATDTVFDPTGSGSVVIPMHRSEEFHGTGTSISNPRQHENEISAFVDASNVYGSSTSDAKWIRTFVDGKLKVSKGNLLPFNTFNAEYVGPRSPFAPKMENPTPFNDRLFVAGDVRANENTYLTVMHTLFMREHNRLCDVLLQRFPNWSDEEIYQRARKLNGAIIQSITFNEWLPAMGIKLAPYTGYNPTVNPGISNEFSAAVFRMGHTLLNANLRRLNEDGSVHLKGNLHLRDAFFNPLRIVESDGIDPFLRGMAEQTQQSFDAKVIEDVRSFLFGEPGAGGLDLAAININRGRERGIANYNTFRQNIGLSKISNWSEVVNDPSLVQLLESIYPDINDVDLWVGMLIETPLTGNLFGETVNKAMQIQFSALRDGDRYFYLNDPELSKDDCAIIQNTKLSDVIKRNTNVELMQSNVFVSMQHSSIPECTASNSEAELVSVATFANGAPLKDVEFRLFGMSDVMPKYRSDTAGLNISTIPTCDDYVIDASYNCASSKGVNTYDLYLISQHLLGARTFDNSLQYLAADVNDSKSLSGFDIALTRRVILEIDSQFNDKPSAVAISEETLPTDPSSVFDAKIENTCALNLFNGTDSAKFVVVKTGDVDFSLSSSKLSPRKTIQLVLAEDPTNNRSVNVSFSTEQLVATQFELVTKANNQILEVQGLDDSQYFINPDRNTIRFAFISENEIKPFNLILKKNSPIELSKQFQPLGYDQEGNKYALQLKRAPVQKKEISKVFTFPNPFTEQLSFSIPSKYADQRPVLKIYNELGQPIFSLDVSKEKVVINAKQLGITSSSLLTWEIINNDYVLDSGTLIYFQ